MTATEDQKPAAGLRVLVVDDNVDAAESLCTLLEMLGHETAAAFDGSAGLAVSRLFCPQVAILDLGLPQLNGYDLARRLRAEPHAPRLLVAVSGYGLPEDRRKSQEAGFHHHLIKPVELEVLQGILSAHGDS